MKTETQKSPDGSSLDVAAGSAAWTIDAGRFNSSPRFLFLVDEVEQLIRNEAHSLIAGRAQDVARLIMAQLAHKHGLSPNIAAQTQPSKA